jgi:predicted glycosyltransferase
VVTTLNRFFDGLLIHSDPTIISLEETFGRVGDIAVPVAYTGFITPRVAKNARAEIRNRCKLTDEERLIVVSIGGGNVGSELVSGAIEAFRLLADNSSYHMQIFTGPYFEQEMFAKLSAGLPPRLRLDRFTEVFPDWLQAADLSVSMAGYNTCMNIVQAGVPALVYPFGQNREQILRATRLRQKATIRILGPADLQAESLAALIREMSNRPRYPATINLDGATGSRQQIELWCGAR